MEYLIIDLQKNSTAQFSFHDLHYSLSGGEVTDLIEQGVLLVSERAYEGDPPGSCGCHRCRKSFRYFEYPSSPTWPPIACPHCHSNGWYEYTLLYCCECHALFEYYWHPLGGGHPYDRFPKCPACKSEHWCPAENERLNSLPSKEQVQAQAEAKRQQEVEAYTRLMEFRKQQELKKLGLRQPSPQAEEKGAAIPEAEAYYKSVDRKTPWLDKGARPVQLPGILPRQETPAPQHPTSTSGQSTPAPQQPTLTPQPAPQPSAVVPRRGVLSVLRNWFRPRRP